MTVLSTQLLTTGLKAGRRRASVTSLDPSAAYPEWTALFNSDQDANPFQHPEYVAAELTGKDFGTGLQPAVVRVDNDIKCEGIGVLIPKTIKTGQAGGIGPGWPLRGLRLAGGSF